MVLPFEFGVMHFLPHVPQLSHVVAYPIPHDLVSACKDQYRVEGDVLEARAGWPERVRKWMVSILSLRQR